MNRITSLLLAGLLVLGLTACGGTTEAEKPADPAAKPTQAADKPADDKADDKADAPSGESMKLVVGATANPAGIILQHLLDSGKAKEAGLDMTIREFSDYVTPNQALEDKSIDANLFQHGKYLDDYVANNEGSQLVNVGTIYLPPLAYYSKKFKSVEELPDGATIAVPNDPTNEGRALQLLASSGAIEFDKTKKDVSGITKNPHNFVFKEITAETLPMALNEVDTAVINYSFASAAGVDPKIRILVEGDDKTYFNILAARKDNVDSPAVQKLFELLTSKENKEWMLKEFNGAVIPS